MKNEEFNEFLRKRAEGFEIKPSSGSFDAVLDKLEKKKGLKVRWVLFSVLTACVAGLLCIAIFSTNGKNDAALQTTTDPNRGPADAEIPIETPAQTLRQISPENITDNKNKAEQPNAISLNPVQTKDAVRKVVQGLNSKEGSITTTDNSPSVSVTPIVGAQQTPILDSNAQATTTTTPNDNSNTAKLDEEPETATALAVTPSTDLPDTEEKNDVLQNDKKGKNKKECNCNGKWSLQAYYNPFATGYYRTTQSDLMYNPAQFSVKNLGQGSSIIVATTASKETPLGGFETGIKVARKISEKWSVLSGLAFNSWKNKSRIINSETEVDSSEIYAVDPITNQQYSYYDVKYNEKQYTEKTITSTYSSVQLPIQAQYIYEKSKWGFSAQMGVNLGYTFRSNQITEIYDKYDSTRRVSYTSSSNTNVTNSFVEKNYRTFNVQFSTGVFANYKLTKCIGLYAGPRISASLLSYNITTSSSTKLNYPAFWGIETGIKISL